MKKTLAIALLGLAGLFALAPPAFAAGKGYQPEKFRPYNGFMKHLMDWDGADLERASDAVYDLTDAGYDRDADPLKRAADLGGELLKKYPNELEPLAGGSFEAVLAPLPGYPPSALDAVDFNTQVVNFNYSRGLGKALVAVAAAHFAAGRSEAAWKTLLAVIRFGVGMRGGDGDPPFLIQTMIGDAIIGLGAGPLFRQVVEEGALPPAALRTIAGHLAATLREMTPLSKTLEGETCGARNTIRHHLFDPSLFTDPGMERTLIEVVGKIAVSDRTRAVDLVIKRYDEVWGRTFEILGSAEAGLVGAEAELDALGQEIGAKGQPGFFSIFSPVETVADVLMSIAYPNMKRAFLKDGEARLKLEGLRIGCLALAAARDGGTFPSTTAEVATLAGTLPRDVYGDGSLRAARDGERFTLYSVGENGTDEGGDRRSDLVLFEASATGETTVTGALGKELEFDDAGARRDYLRTVGTAGDPTVRAEADRRLGALGGKPVPMAGSQDGPTSPTVPDEATRACLANLRVMEGATELWVMEHPEDEGKPLPADLADRLVKENYLKVKLSCPSGGTYERDAKGLRCTRHGSLEVETGR